jgi:hypothetical protein
MLLLLRDNFLSNCAFKLSMGLEKRIKALEMAPGRRDGQILADLHNHVSKALSMERLLDISTHGVLGVTRHVKMDGTFTYDELLYTLKQEAGRNRNVAITELEPGLSMVQYDHEHEIRTGYIVETNEFFADKSHLVSIGGDEPPLYSDRKGIQALKDSGAVVILAHPYEVNRTDKGVMTRFIRNPGKHPEIAQGIEAIAEEADAIESFNAQEPHVFKLNAHAAELATRHGKPGIHTTDTHPYQLAEFLDGVYVPEEGLSIEALGEAIKRGDFEPAETRYVPLARLASSYALLGAQYGLGNIQRRLAKKG